MKHCDEDLKKEYTFHYQTVCKLHWIFFLYNAFNRERGVQGRKREREREGERGRERETFQCSYYHCLFYYRLRYIHVAIS